MICDMERGEFVIAVTGSQSADELEDKCRQLRDDIDEVGVTSGDVPGEPAPKGTRSVEIATAGLAFIVSVYGVKVANDGPKVKEALIEDLRRIRRIASVIHSWMHRNPDTHAIVKWPNGTEVDLKGFTEDGVQDVIRQVEPKSTADDA
jgi:hypothetical protein